MAFEGTGPGRVDAPAPPAPGEEPEAFKALDRHIDSRGLARQLRGWLERMDVACATPKPLCSLTERDYKVTRRERETYQNNVISEFAKYFGQPDIRLTLDPDLRTVTSAFVQRDAVCGCARHVAEKLIGLSADEAEEKAGLFHHHFPCLASMVKLNDYNHDTLMHESGHLLQENLAEQLKPYKKTRYIAPSGRALASLTPPGAMTSLLALIDLATGAVSTSASPRPRARRRVAPRDPVQHGRYSDRPPARNAAKHRS